MYKCVPPGQHAKTIDKQSCERADLCRGASFDVIKLSILSLQVAASFACSVASLSHFPAFSCQAITFYMVKALQTTSLVGESSPHAKEPQDRAHPLHCKVEVYRSHPPTP